MVVIDLTKDGFIANVGDFEANPKDWKYIGSRPCLIDFIIRKTTQTNF